MSEPQDSEITLGTGRLLGLFFGLVILCAVFFAFGFTLGRNSAKSEPISTLPVPAAVAASGAPKPGAGKSAKTNCPEGQNCEQPPAGSDELTFYKAVEQKDPEAKLEPEKPAEDARFAPEMAKPAIGGYMVQVAAVSKVEDAEALASALRKKQYPVFTTTTQSDALFHVQVGPFAELKDAEAIKAKLMGDGYNPIVKK